MNPSAADECSLQMDRWNRRLRARWCRLYAGRMYSMVILRLVASRSADSLSWSVCIVLHSVTFIQGLESYKSNLFNGLREVRRIWAVRLILYVFVKVIQGECDRLVGKIVKELDEAFMESRNIRRFYTQCCFEWLFRANLLFGHAWRISWSRFKSYFCMGNLFQRHYSWCMHVWGVVG